MEVHHGLAGGSPYVYADVVAVGVEVFVEEGFRLADEGEEGGVLGGGCVEEVRDMAEGDDEEVAGACRVLIVSGVAEVVCEDYVFWRGVTEGAG